jgi:hypothetical protein
MTAREYRVYEIKRTDDRNRGWGIFEKGTTRFAWICEYWNDPVKGLQIVANHCPHRTIKDAKDWIDNDFTVDDGQIVIFAETREAAINELHEMLTKPKPPALPPMFLDDFPPELIG